MRTHLAIAIIGLLLSASPSYAMLMENGDGGDGGGGGTTTTTTTTTNSSACTSSKTNCPGATCTNLGQTQMSADKVSIIACLAVSAGSSSYQWKAMSTNNYSVSASTYGPYGGYNGTNVGGTYFSFTCPPGTALIAISGSAGQYVDEIVPTCGPVNR